MWKFWLMDSDPKISFPVERYGTQFNIAKFVFLGGWLPAVHRNEWSATNYCSKVERKYLRLSKAFPGWMAVGTLWAERRTDDREFSVSARNCRSFSTADPASLDRGSSWKSDDEVGVRSALMCTSTTGTFLTVSDCCTIFESRRIVTWRWYVDFFTTSLSLAVLLVDFLSEATMSVFCTTDSDAWPSSTREASPARTQLNQIY